MMMLIYCICCFCCDLCVKNEEDLLSLSVEFKIRLISLLLLAVQLVTIKHDWCDLIRSKHVSFLWLLSIPGDEEL